MQFLNQTVIKPTGNTTKKSNPVIITGGAGFIGSNLIKAFNEDDLDRIVIVDYLGTGDKWKNLLGLKFIDVVPPEKFVEWARMTELNNFSHLIHLGGTTDTLETDNDEILWNNYTLTQGMKEVCQMKGLRLIYASSCNVYGDGLAGFDDTKDVSTYNGKQVSMYGLSKFLCDSNLLAEDPDETDPISLRIFNAYGNREGHKGDTRGAMGRMIQQLISGETVDIIDSERDFIYVKDICNIILRFYHMDRNVGGGAYNIGTGIATSDLDAANIANSVLNDGKEFKTNSISGKSVGKFQKRTCATTAKLLHTIGKFNFTSIEDGVKDMENEGIS